MRVYRDCNGVGVQYINDTPMKISGDNCSVNFNVNLILDSVVDITKLCRSVQTRCENPSSSYPYGIQKVTLHAEIDLSAYPNCCNWTFNWERLARNHAITTLVDPGNTYLNTGAKVNTCVDPCNNSPRLTNDPIAIICIGQPFNFNNGAVDEDGDSLTYELADPMSGNGSQANFNWPYNKLKPLSYVGHPAANPANFGFNGVTGDFYINPNLKQVGVLVIQINQYRKINGQWVKVGETRRDMQIIVDDNCNNKPPTLSGPYNWEVCAGSELCFDILSNDLDINPQDTVTIAWNRGIPKGTFSANNGASRTPTGTFCWTPTDADVSTLPYYFTVSAADNRCPKNATNIRSYTVVVNPTPKSNRIFTDQGCGMICMNSVPLGDYGSTQYRWTLLHDNTKFYSQQACYKYAAPGKYVIRHDIISKGCASAYFDTVLVKDFMRTTLMKDTFVCEGQGINITSTTTGGSPPYKYKWLTGNLADTSHNFSTKTIQPKNSSWYYMMATDATGCVQIDSIFIKVIPLPDPRFGIQYLCFNDTLTLDAGIAMQYKWYNKGNLVSTSRMLSTSVEDTFIVWLKDSLGCENYDTAIVKLNSKIIVGPIPDISICKGDTFRVEGSGATFYKWFNLTNPGDASFPRDSFVLTTAPASTTTYVVKGFLQQANQNCNGSDTFTVNVLQRPVINMPTYRDRCITDKVPFVLFGANPGGGVWTCPQNPALLETNAGLTTFRSDLVPAPGTYRLYYSYISQVNGCSQTEYSDLIFFPLPVIQIGGDKVLCENSPLTKMQSNISNSVFSGNGIIEIPIGSKEFYFDAATAGVGTHQIVCTATDVNGCTNSDTVEYKVNPVPVIDAGFLNEVCASAANIDLNVATGATPAGGSWSGNGVVTDLGVFFPSVNKTSSVQYYTLYYSYTLNGCTSIDSLRIKVNPNPAITFLSYPPVVCIDFGDVRIEPTPLGGKLSCSDKPNSLVNGIFYPHLAGVGGPYAINYEYTDPITGCKSSATTFISVQPKPLIKAHPVQSICEGDSTWVSATVTGNTAAGILWTSDDPSASFGNDTLLNTYYKPGTLDVQRGYARIFAQTTNLSGCNAQVDSVRITVYPLPLIDFSSPKYQDCVPFKPVLNVNCECTSPNCKYEWDFGDGTLSSAQRPSHTYTKAGTYTITVKVTSPYGCISRYNRQYFAWPQPVADFEYRPSRPTAVEPMVYFINTSKEVDTQTTFEWFFGDAFNSSSNLKEPQFTYPRDTGNYLVTLNVKNIFGCTSSITKPIRVFPEIMVFIPNAFSPNGGGPLENNTFKPYTYFVTDYHFQIFDRWGELLFESFDQNEGWNGDYLSKPCQEDVYIYLLKVKGINEEIRNYNGTITLLR